MTCGIYEIVNTANGKRYVGSSVNIERRLGEHLRSLRGGRHPNRKLQNSYTKYGEKSFRHGIIAECSPDVLIELEQLHIDSGAELNLSPTAGNTLGRPVSDTTRRKHSLAMIEVWKDQEYRESQSKRMTIQAKSQWADNETRAKMSDGISRSKREGYENGSLISPLVYLWMNKDYRNSRTGENNHNYNPHEYTFFHSELGIFTGSKMHFHRHSGADRSDVNKLVSGKINSIKGWTIKKAPEGA